VQRELGDEVAPVKADRHDFHVRRPDGGDQGAGREDGQAGRNH
jgi:hypothetical protein